MKLEDKPKVSFCSRTNLWYCEKVFDFQKVADAGFTPERAFRNWQRRLRRSNVLPQLKAPYLKD